MRRYRQGLPSHRSAYAIGVEPKRKAPKPLWKELLVFLPAIIIPIGLWKSDQAIERGFRGGRR